MTDRSPEDAAGAASMPERAAGAASMPEHAAGAASMLRHTLFARAALLAREGKRDAAAALLGEADDPAGLDLLARVRAQQGALLEAERLWQGVLRIDPGHPGAIAALARLHRSRRRGPGAAALLLTIGVVAALGVAALLYQAAQRQAAEIAALRQQLDQRQALFAAQADQRAAALDERLNGVSKAMRDDLADISSAQGEQIRGRIESLESQMKRQNQMMRNLQRPPAPAVEKSAVP